MRQENKNMKEVLKRNGINCTPKYLYTGSMKGNWRLDDYKLNKNKPQGIGWWKNTKLQEKLTSLGFVNFDGEPLNDFCGNGGQFSVFVKLTDKFLEEAILSNEASFMVN